VTPWDARALRATVDESLAAFGAVDAPSTWVLSNHDVIRHPSRLALDPPPPQGEGIGPRSERPDEVLGLRRGRAATAFMLALPGSAYLFQGEELGLPEVIDLPDSARQDPTFARTLGRNYGRDGCRVPIPWEVTAPAAGFSPTGASWLPQPSGWESYARDAQRGVPGSTLELYTAAISARREHGLASNAIEWLPSEPGVLAFRSGGLTIVANTAETPATLPPGEIVVASGPAGSGLLPGDTTVWLRP
jgi:alpha-glucosidase